MVYGPRSMVYGLWSMVYGPIQNPKSTRNIMAQYQEQEEDEALGKAYDSQLLRRLWGFVRPYRLRVFLALLLLIGEALASIAPPYIVQRAIDGPLTEGRPERVWIRSEERRVGKECRSRWS